jgi:hypothetical protein
VVSTGSSLGDLSFHEKGDRILVFEGGFSEWTIPGFEKMKEWLRDQDPVRSGGRALSGTSGGLTGALFD